MKKLLVFSFFLTSIVGFSQKTWNDFTGEQKAFFYNIARKTDNLNIEIFPLFQFTDSIPYINDTLPDYKYVEKKIVKNPDLLILHTDQMARKSCGLVSDLATKFALWELDAVLHYRNTTSVDDANLKERLKVFEQYVLEDAPQSAVRTLSDGKYVLEKSLLSYYAPTLTIGDKKAAIGNTGYSKNDQMLILNAIMAAAQKYIEIRSLEIVEALGGNAESYKNYLSAVGDGDNWSEILAGFKTPYNNSLPDDIALFAFNTEVRKVDKTEEEYVAVNEVTKKNVVTSTTQKTVLHFDVAGYHPERQTTVVIQKGDRSYILYGKNEHRLISPDSAYGEGTTYWRLMWDLEHVHIAQLRENLYGKRGYEYWIDIYEKRIESTLLKIKKTEYKLDQLRRQPNPPPKIKKKKIKKKDLGKSDQDGQGHPTAPLTKLDKKRNIEQNRLVHLNTLLENEKNKLAELKKEMEEAYFILVKYESLLDQMQKNMGYAVMSYEVENDIYTFSDGATFNYRTQDFTFARTQSAETFQVLHLTFGKTVFATQIDENFIHVNQSYANPNAEHVFKKLVRHIDPINSFTISDSIQTMEIFRALMHKKVDLNLEVYAGGIIGGDNGDYFRDSSMQPTDYVKENEAKESALEYFGTYNAHVNLKVTYWKNSMLPFDYSIFESGFLAAKKKDDRINRIDYYTAVVAKKAAIAWKDDMILKAETWIEDPKERAMVIKKLKGANVKHVKFINGQVLAPVKVP